MGGSEFDLMQTFDFNAIEDMDPSLSDGSRTIYDREVPFELRVQENTDGPQQVGTLEAIRVKVLLLGDDDAPQSVRMELSSEADLFFHYTHEIAPEKFRDVADTQRLMVEFNDYPNILIRMLNQCIKEPHNHLAVFVMQHDVHARLDFIQNMEHKMVEMLTVEFQRTPEDTVQHHITYRYNAMKSRLALMQARLQDVNNLVKLKNPSLLLQLQKTQTLSSPR
ncbi:unnamed protein product [Chrysoparadoxa australica]